MLRKTDSFFAKNSVALPHTTIDRNGVILDDAGV
jgi:hypothetical protein